MTTTYTEIIDNLSAALDGTYRALQSALKEARVAGVLESRLNLKWAELKVLANQVIEFLQNLTVQAQDIEDKEQLDRVSACPNLPDTVARWQFWKKDTTDVVMVYIPTDYAGGLGYYVTYANDANTIDRHTDRIHTYTRLEVEKGKTVELKTITIPRIHYQRYRLELKAQRIFTKEVFF